MAEQSKRKDVTVLVVDDQPDVRTVLRRILERGGKYSITEAGTAAEALDAVDDAPPDAMILDISMPGGPGFTVISTIRRSCPETKILVLSGHDGMESEVLAMGAHAFLPKTAPPKRVLKTLAALIAT